MIDEIFGYKFKDIELLEAALTHPSFHSDNNYQRLEFLGDRILDLAISEHIFDLFPNENEGDLAKRQVALVCGKMIACVAQENNLGPHIRMSAGEEAYGGRENQSNLENVMEAILGAIFLDNRDYNIVKEVVLRLWQEKFLSFKKPPQDPKSELQEILQKNNLPLPEYKLVSQSGFAHAPLFKIKIIVSGQDSISVIAGNKKKGELELAELMLKRIKHGRKKN